MGLKVFSLLSTPLNSSSAHGWTGLAQHFQLVQVSRSKSRGAGWPGEHSWEFSTFASLGGITPLELPSPLLLVTASHALKLPVGL